MLRRLHPEQPDSFAFTPDNQAWAEAQITKYPEGRQASAIIPLLWRAQEQEGWLTRPAIEAVADMLGMAHIRALEVATFYFMFQLAPVGSVAHIQICGTTSCMICGAEDLVGVCKRQDRAEAASAQRRWQVLVGRGRVPRRLCQRADGADRQGLLRGPDGREACGAHRRDGGGQGADAGAAERALRVGARGRADLAQGARGGRDPLNASARLAADIGDTIKRIDGTEVPLLAPWGKQSGGDAAVAERPAPAPKAAPKAAPKPAPPRNPRRNPPRLPLPPKRWRNPRPSSSPPPATANPTISRRSAGWGRSSKAS
jgi:NADH-quinone oxidoreductase subunit E